MVPRPRLVLVGGIPGAGKTTLAARLGDALPAPVLMKDAIKEGISLTEAAKATFGGPIAERTFAALYACTEVLLQNGCTVVLEAAFHRDWFEKEMARFRPMADLRLLLCRTSRDLAASRHRERAERGDARRLAHPDEMVIGQMAEGSFPWEAYELEGFDLQTLVVNTTEGYAPSLEAMLEFVTA